MRRFIRTATALAAVTFSAGALVVAAGTTDAGAAGLNLVPTTTVVSLSSTTIAQGQGITVSGNVKPLNVALGLGVTPAGTVSFTATSGATSYPLGSGSIPVCLAVVVATVTACTVTLTAYPPLTPGTWTIKASYGGDTAMVGSSGVATLSVTADPFVAACTAADDTANGGCEGDGYSNNPTTGNQTQLSVFQDTDGADGVDISFGGPNLSCSTAANTGGQIADFFTTDTAPNDYKSLSYTVLGPAADTVNTAYPEGNAPICYGSSVEFQTASGTPAPFVNGEYEGLVPLCTDEYSGTPCIAYEDFSPGDPGHDSFTWDVDASGGDPRMGGGGG